MSKLIRPIISEKANYISAGGVYAFRVSDDSNKFEIKKIIEGMYKVNVRKVNFINIPPKRRIMRGRVGYKSGFKKAMVYLNKGQKIELA